MQVRDNQDWYNQDGGFRLVYVTCGSPEEAKAIGRAAVEARLAACANVLPGMVPIFRWEGRIEEGSETVLLLKTRASLVERLTRAVRERHSYEVPCIVALPLEAGHQPFLDWIAAETDGG